MAKAKPVSAEERKAIGARLKAGREKAAAEKAELSRLREENAQLKAAHDGIPSSARAAAALADSLDLGGRKEKPNESRDAVKDDLAWIGPDVHAVYLVSKNMTLTLRPVNTDVFPPVQSVAIHSYDSGPWTANPFSLRSAAQDHETRATEEKLNAVMYANWGYFKITRPLAESVYGDERNPLPKTAVISGKEFRGYDRDTRRAVGVHRPLVNPDPLREVVRTMLQRMAGSTYIDASRHGEHIDPINGFDPRRPNPYGMRLGNLAQKLPSVEREGATS